MQCSLQPYWLVTTLEYKAVANMLIWKSGKNLQPAAAAHLLGLVQGVQVPNVELRNGAWPYTHTNNAGLRCIWLQQHGAQVLVNLGNQLLLAGLLNDSSTSSSKQQIKHMNMLQNIKRCLQSLG
jgi:hypothetical protein